MKRVPSKKSLYLLGLLVITLIGFVIMPTYAKFGSSYVTENDVVGLALNFNVGINNIEEYEELDIAAGEYKLFNVEIENATSDTLYYGIWYRMIEPTTKTSDITIARLEGIEITTSESIDASAIKTVSIIIINNSNSEITVDIGVASSATNTTDIGYLRGKYLITSTAEKPVTPANAPNLNNGNLIPVYYDDTVQASDGTYGVWKKADSTNSNNSWYNYDNKMWANAIIVSNDTLSTYQSADVGTTITEADIIAFYVWIPRYKYRVWNITRQGGAEDTYAYPAYSTGIEIQFETGTASTGNVECTYDITTEESETDLSDVCVYNGTDTITTDSGNTNYNDAWYTHPAFTFGDEEVEGFWIGKFETSATTSSTCYTSPSATNCSNANQEPRILPNVSSLRSQTVSYQFTTAKKFQKYFSDDIEAHMLTNLEWGAVAYLTHSIYGLCDASGCKGLKFNNSEGYFTGRSGGDIARNALKAAAFYGDTSLSAENIYIQNGYYNYKGYKLNSSGVVTSTKDVSAIASTTGNVTGIYDMAGGSNEYVMGNMADSAGLFYSRLAGTNWNGNSILDTKYYNAYSFGINSYKPIAFNRARLGDAIAENLGSSTSNIALWSPGYGVTGSSSQMFFDDGETQHYWLHRGGNSKSVYSSIFYLYRASGDSSSGFSFRSSIS